MDTVLNVNQELIKAGMAEPNPHHMAVLKQIAAVALPDKYEELMQWQENVDDAISLSVIMLSYRFLMSIGLGDNQTD